MLNFREWRVVVGRPVIWLLKMCREEPITDSTRVTKEWIRRDYTRKDFLRKSQKVDMG